MLGVAGCPTVDLGDSPQDIGLCNPAGGVEYLRDELWPKFIRPLDGAAGCTRSGGCHSESGGNALALRGSVTLSDTDAAFNYRQTQLYLNCGQPAASPLLTKPLGGIDPHGGDDLITQGDAAEAAFLGWFR